MTDFKIIKLPYDLTPNAGLALVGQYLKRIDLPKLVDRAFPKGPLAVANSDILKSYLGLLVQGKNDFDAIEAYRHDQFFSKSLGITTSVPSSPTLRQRMDEYAGQWMDLAEAFNLSLLGGVYAHGTVDFGALPCGYMPIDWDTFVMDNANTQKEEVGRTYQGVDGYAPSVAYIGQQGYCLQLALRPGEQHSANETEFNLERILPMATQLTDKPLLFRADSGLCSKKIMRQIVAQSLELQREIAFVIKWNPRTTPIETIAKERTDAAQTHWIWEREGKRSTVWQEEVSLESKASAQQKNAANTPEMKALRVFRLTERILDKRGNPLLLPQYELEAWTHNLPASFDAQTVIALYQDHATHEQFHSEFKSDMDLERLPSGKFDTNYLVCAMAAVAMNILRLIGQNALLSKDSPVRHKAKRRRIKTVMQELMFRAARMVKHAGRWCLGLGEHDAAFIVFERLYETLVPKRKPRPA